MNDDYPILDPTFSTLKDGEEIEYHEILSVML